MPAATLPVPRLLRRSLRTIPESASALSDWFEAFEPSAGYGPAVSSGMSLTQATADALALGVADGVAPAPRHMRRSRLGSTYCDLGRPSVYCLYTPVVGSPCHGHQRTAAPPPYELGAG